MEISATDLDVLPCEVSEIRDFVESNHYSHNLNGVRISYCFKVEHYAVLVGAVVFGCMSTTAWKKFGEKEQDVLELRRLVLVDEAGRNSESRVVGRCLRWIKKNAKHIKIIVSYADPAHGHSGVIYRASNFKYIGLSGKDKGFRDPETGKTYHSRAMRIKYKGEFKPFVKKLRAKHAAGLLEVVDLPGKHCFTYQLT